MSFFKMCSSSIGLNIQSLIPNYSCFGFQNILLKVKASFSVVNKKWLYFLTLTQSPIFNIKIPPLVHILIITFILGLSTNCWAVDNFDKTQPAGTASAADIDALIIANNNSVDRLFSNYRSGCKLIYASASTVTVGTGSIVCNNSAGTIRRLRANTSTVTMAWSNIDTGSEAASTTYYVYAVGDTDAATFTVKLSTNATSPTGITYYKRLGSFYNNASSNIITITNDDIPQLRTYDSDWFAVSIGSKYSKTHSLGTTEFIGSIYFSASSDGTNAHSSVGIKASHTSPDRKSGMCVKNITTSTFDLQTGATYVSYTPSDDVGNLTSQTSGYARVIILALE